MDFVTFSPTMSKSELYIPRRRRPVHDLLSRGQEDRDKHPIVAYLEQDSRWHDLSRSPHSRYLQFRVLDTAMQIHLMSKDQVDAKITELDNEILFSPYLNTLSQKRGTLREQHEEMVEISTIMLDDAHLLEGLGIPPEGSYLIPYLFTQIHLAERALGRKIEKDREIAWTTEKGFADPAVDVAIELCMAAVRDIPSTDIY